ncbi:MAG: hypothetical protein ACHQVS_00695 [Candidatus Babeliales bacterium]
MNDCIKGYVRILVILALIGHLIQAYYVIQLCREELTIIDEDRNMELADWFSDKGDK